MSEWTEASLGDFILFKNGKSSPERDDLASIPVYGSNGIIGFSEQSNTPKNCLIVGRVGSYCGSVYFSSIPCWVTDNAIIGLPKQQDEAEFWYFLLVKLNLNTLRSGSGQPLLNQSILNSITIRVPKTPEIRQKIGTKLMLFDDKIALNREMNKTLEAMAQAIFKSWFVDFEPFKEGEFFESELGMIPKGWEVKSLTEDFVITMGQSPDGKTYNENGEGIPFFQGRTDFGFRFPSNRIYCTDPKRYAKKFDTLVSVRAPVGDMNIAINDCCIGRGLSAVRHKNGYYSFTYYLLKSIDEKFKQFEHNGTVFGSINKTSFENLKVIIPIESLIFDFEKIVNAIDDQIYTLSGEIQTLSTLRDTLLPKLLSGEIGV